MKEDLKHYIILCTLQSTFHILYSDYFGIGICIGIGSYLTLSIYKSSQGRGSPVLTTYLLVGYWCTTVYGILYILTISVYFLSTEQNKCLWAIGKLSSYVPATGPHCVPTHWFNLTQHIRHPQWPIPHQ